MRRSQSGRGDVLGRAQDGTCGTEDDHAHKFACPFRKGTGDVDAGIHEAHGLGRARCGAIENRNDLTACPRAFLCRPSQESVHPKMLTRTEKYPEFEMSAR